MTGDGTPLWQYAAGVVGFTVGFIALLAGCAAVGRWVSRRVDAYVDRHVRRALGRNVVSLPLERAVRQHPAGKAKVTVPRQLG